MVTKLDESPSQSPKLPQSENGNAQNKRKNSHRPATLRYNPKIPIKIASINVNGINRKLNSLNAIFKNKT